MPLHFGNGFLPACADCGEGAIIDGHIRWEAACRLGLEAIPCIVIDHLAKNEVRLLAISLNRMAENGEWDLSALQIELADLRALDFDLSLTGFSALEMDILLQDPMEKALNSLNEETEADLPIVTVSGDLWLLGNHRLYCGSSLEQHSYTSVLGDERARMSFGDPPYNLKIPGVVSGNGKAKHGDFAMGCGEMSDAEFRAFLRQYLELSAQFCLPNSVIFACMDWRQSHNLVLAAQEAKLQLVQMCIWDKGVGGMGSLYRNAFEQVHVYCNGKTPAVNNIQLGKSGRDRTNVQHYPGANQLGSSAAKALQTHATPKPVELVEDYMLDVSAKGDIVLDPFMGSGTTIIAAQKCDRRAYGIELEPRFVDCAIRRWEDMTGLEAVHANTRVSFAETALIRQEGGAEH